MVRKAYLVPLVLIPAFIVFAVSVHSQGLDEDVAVADEELVVDEAVAGDALPADDGLEVMALPGMDLPEIETEPLPVGPVAAEEAPPLPAEAVLPVDEVPELPALPVEEVPELPALPVEEETPIVAVEPEPALPVAEVPELPDVPEMADDALGGAELPVAEVPAIEELPVAEIPVVEELPVAEVPAIEELPVAEIPAVEELPVAEVPAIEEMPVAEIPVVEELPVEPLPVVEEMPVAALPEVEPIPAVEPAPEVAEPIPAVEPIPMVEPAPVVEILPGVEPPAPAPEPVRTIESVFTGSENLVEDAVREAMSGGAEPVPNLSTLPIDPRVAQVSAAMTQEAIRRKAYETHALQTLLEAEMAMQDELYEKALKLYEEARRYLGLRVELEPERVRIMTGLATSCYEQAKVFWQEKDWEQAKNMAKASKRYGHPDGTKLLELIQEDEVRPPPIPPKEKVKSRRYSTNVMDEKGNLKVSGYIEKEKDISRRFKLGKQYYQTEEYEKAQEIFETILKYDPHNIEAIRLLEKVARRLSDTGQMERETTRRDMVADVINTWNPRDYGKMEPDYIPVPESSTPKVSQNAEERDEIMKKLKTIVIPEIDFRQANINDVVEFLQEQSVAFDKDEKSSRKGVNIILNLASAGGAAGGVGPAADAGPIDPFAAAAPEAAAGGGGSDVPLITFSARYISLLEALDIVTSVANLKHRIKGSVVMVVQKDDPEQDIVHRMYDVLSDISSKIEALAPAAAATGVGGGAFGGGGGGFGGGGDATLNATGLGTGDRADWKEFFAGFGVGWPRGASITYMPSVGKIFVANTPDNLVIFERILDVFNVTPSQIEIEARFVEVGQTDLDSLGIEWMLSDDWEVKQKKGDSWLPPGQKQRVVIGQNASTGGFTKGNRYLSDLNQSAVLSITGADDILSVASVLTNPELAMVLHALNQKGNTDLLSAPKVTTKSGQQATIKVVTEYIYPTDFEVTPILAATDGGSAVVGGIVQPGGFQTREVGVLLEVLPEVSTEGQLINLTLTPQVVGDPEWKNYGSSYVDPFGNFQQLPMEQPFFHVRTITTSLSIYNGATVVMGGMITEHRNDVDDRIPLLGDIPVIGRLFRSKYNHSQKRNLLIFVTARLVDPAGRPLKSIESKIEALAGSGVGGGTAAAAPANQ